MGRTGVLTPVAHVKPVIVGGVTMRNITMHNEAQVNEKGVYVGARVVIHRAGDVIPEIVSVMKPKEGWRMPGQVPGVRGRGRARGALHRASLHQSVLRGAAPGAAAAFRQPRLALNIEGLGYATVEPDHRARVGSEDPSDLFRLTKEQAMELEGFADKSAPNLTERHSREQAAAVGACWTRSAFRRWAGDGGPAGREFGSIHRLRSATEEDLVRTEGVGPSMATEIEQYFKGHGGELVTKLLVWRGSCSDQRWQGWFRARCSVADLHDGDKEASSPEAGRGRLGGKAGSNGESEWTRRIVVQVERDTGES